MKVIPQYKVIDPYNYGRIIRNIGNKYAKRQDFRSDKWKDVFEFKNKNLCNSLKWTFPNTLKEKNPAVAVLLLVIYTFILNIY